MPHVEGRDWQWNDTPELVVQSFLRNDEAVHVSGFVPAANGGADVRPDSPSLRTFRTVNNLVGFYLLEHNDQTNVSFSLRIIKVANVTQPLADIDFEGVTVSGKHGAAVKILDSSPNSASTLPPNIETLLDWGEPVNGLRGAVMIQTAVQKPGLADRPKVLGGRLDAWNEHCLDRNQRLTTKLRLRKS